MSSTVKTQTKSSNISQLCYKDTDGRWIPVDAGHPLPTNAILTAQDYAIRLEEVGDLTYVGKATAGSANSSPVWQIKRIDETSGLIVLFADGNTAYDNSWSGYSGYPYS
jgi:hypothetical protein